MKKFLIALLILGVQEACGKLPPFIKACKRNDPNIANCILNTIYQLKPVLISGNLLPGSDYVPSIEPFYIPSIQIGNRKDFKAVFTNVFVKGGSKFVIEKLRANVEELRFDALIRFPSLNFAAKYDLIFGLFGLKLKGQGDAAAIIDNSRGRISMKARKYVLNGVEYINFEKFHIKIAIGDIKFAHLDNLFDGRSPIFNEVANNLIKTQPEFLVQEIYPPIESHLSEVFTTIANKMVQGVTMNELFPLA